MKNLKRLIIISIFAIGLMALASLGFAQSEGSGTVGGGQILGPVAGESGSGARFYKKACLGHKIITNVNKL